jgi:hypothetical protein
VTVPAAGPGYTSRWFKVPKSDLVSARLVQNLAALSRHVSPPRVPFSRLHVLVRRLLAQPAVLLADFRNWFYQIPLPLAWRKWFRARVVCGRGAFFDVELFVLSMGFALSVFIAHSLALAVARRAAETTAVDHDAWVDNLVWAGPPANLRRTAAELERLRGELSFTWSAAPALHEDTFEFLGLEFSLRKKVVVPSAALRGKIAAGCADIVAQPSLRTALSVIGLLCWVNWAVARCPLAFTPALLSWLRAACRDLSALDVAVPLPPAVVEDVLRLAEITSSSALSLADLAGPLATNVSLFSDASDAALAAVCREGGSVDVRAWAAPGSMTIFAREALAACFALSLVPRPVRAAGLAIDNLNLLFALRRGHSASDVVNEILRRIFAELWRRRLRLSTVFVPSARQLADFPSRGRPLPPDWAEYFSLSGLVPLPPWRVPASEMTRALSAPLGVPTRPLFVATAPSS